MSNNQNFSCFGLHKSRYAFQLIKFSIANYDYINLETYQSHIYIHTSQYIHTFLLIKTYF